jgi:hypothetical protein
MKSAGLAAAAASGRGLRGRRGLGGQRLLAGGGELLAGAAQGLLGGAAS